MLRRKTHSTNQTQLELPIERPLTPDRNASLGGRSFYFFDFDDNVMHLKTPLFLFHKSTGQEMQVSTQMFAQISEHIGHEGIWADYELRLDDHTGTFRRFREKNLSVWQRIRQMKQPLVEDIALILKEPDFVWRGPSWDFFWHAVHNGRPLSIITARGHAPQTLKAAIRLLYREGFLTREPNYLDVFPVSHVLTKKNLGDAMACWSVAQLKKAAIIKSVQAAFELYGANPAHQFGMSDDDPSNIALIIEAMEELKKTYPKNSFFVIDTHGGHMIKQEIFSAGVQSTDLGLALQKNQGTQLALFELVEQVNASHIG